MIEEEVDRLQPLVGMVSNAHVAQRTVARVLKHRIYEAIVKAQNEGWQNATIRVHSQIWEPHKARSTKGRKGFEHYKNYIEIKIEEGEVVSVEALEEERYTNSGDGPATEASIYGGPWVEIISPGPFDNEGNLLTYT